MCNSFFCRTAKNVTTIPVLRSQSYSTKLCLRNHLEANSIVKRCTSTAVHQTNTPTTLSSDIAANRKILESAARQLNIKELDDWYRITTKVPLIHHNSSSSRISSKSVLAISSTNTTGFLPTSFPTHSQNTPGYHGNSHHVLPITGKM